MACRSNDSDGAARYNLYIRYSECERLLTVMLRRQ